MTFPCIFSSKKIPLIPTIKKVSSRRILRIATTYYCWYNQYNNTKHAVSFFFILNIETWRAMCTRLSMWLPWPEIGTFTMLFVNLHLYHRSGPVMGQAVRQLLDLDLDSIFTHGFIVLKTKAISRKFIRATTLRKNQPNKLKFSQIEKIYFMYEKIYLKKYIFYRLKKYILCI